MADARVGVIRRRVVGAAAAYTLARRGVTSVLLEAEVEFGLATSGTNSGIVHTSIPCEVKTEFILRDAELRAVVFGQSGNATQVHRAAQGQDQMFKFNVGVAGEAAGIQDQAAGGQINSRRLCASGFTL